VFNTYGNTQGFFHCCFQENDQWAHVSAFLAVSLSSLYFKFYRSVFLCVLPYFS